MRVAEADEVQSSNTPYVGFQKPVKALDGGHRRQLCLAFLAIPQAIVMLDDDVEWPRPGARNIVL